MFTYGIPTREDAIAMIAKACHTKAYSVIEHILTTVKEPNLNGVRFQLFPPNQWGWYIRID